MRPRESRADPAHLRAQFADLVAGMSTRNVVPERPEFRIFALEERDDQIVLGGEMAIETGRCDARFLNNKIDPDGSNAASIEEARGDIENPSANGTGGVVGRGTRARRRLPPVRARDGTGTAFTHG